ncbi:MAG: hypothetical protein LBK82_16630 [Planctomycetaceae bacterium]|jgi:hypothetical protein|nr:hypothetical protein [Planctomycetaceae bacterium]
MVATLTKNLKKRKVGRPHIPKNQQRTKQISVRFTKEELYRLEEIRVKEHTAELIRKLALEAIERRKKTSC